MLQNGPISKQVDDQSFHDRRGAGEQGAQLLLLLGAEILQHRRFLNMASEHRIHATHILIL